MSVITNTPVPQMQLHTIFTELHIQVRPAGLAGCWHPQGGSAGSGLWQVAWLARGKGVRVAEPPSRSSGSRIPQGCKAVMPLCPLVWPPQAAPTLVSALWL